MSERDEPVVITDKRTVDRNRATSAPEAREEVAQPGDTVLAERTADLQRVQAEYANYRKRVERDRLLAGELATGRVLSDLLPVLDNLDRARDHGDLTGGLKAVADQLETVFTKLGLVAFGEVGDLFDPSVHEAVLHDESEAVDRPTCTTVMRQGYKHNDRLLRPAMVGVSDPVAVPAPAPAPVAAPVAEDLEADVVAQSEPLPEEDAE